MATTNLCDSSSEEETLAEDLPTSAKMIQFDSAKISYSSILAKCQGFDLKLGDTLLSLVRFKNGCLGTAVICVNKIVFGGKIQNMISMEEFNSEASLTGRVLKFDNFVDDHVIWNRNFSNLITVESIHSLIFNTSLKDGLSEILTFINLSNLVEANNALKTIFNSFSQQTINKLPMIDNPFSDDIFNLFLMSNRILKNEELLCLVCNQRCTTKLMRFHVAKHIFRNHCVPNCCGFCGLSCGSILEIRKSSGYGVNQNFKPFSNCKYFYAFSLAPAEKAKKRVEKTGRETCSNRPVVCKLCRLVFWSYNMDSHYDEKHNASPYDTDFKLSHSEKNALLKSKKF